MAQGGPSSAAARRRRRGFWIAGGIGLFLLLLAAVAVVLILLALSGGRAGSTGATPVPETFEEEYVSGEGSDKIAVVPIVGTIGDAGSGDVLGGSAADPETLRDRLRQAAGDEGVRAVVLEVNSPGGGVTASDEMHDAIVDFKREARKPVVVAMGSTAASGGYYVSAPASRIFARAGTLTGSIGVVLTRPVAADLLDRIGVNPRTVGPGADNDFFDLRREPSERELTTLQERLVETYNEFKDRVKGGRGIASADLEPIAGGRVWTGEEALQRGLVDEVGGFREALEAAKSLAGIKGDDPRTLAKVRAPGSRPSPGGPAKDASEYVEGVRYALGEFGVARVWAVAPFDLGEDL